MDLRELIEGGVEEQVTTNQRALIEKILARYSGEFTVYRELLQNSNDANSDQVEIHFRTSASSAQLLHKPDGLPNLKTNPISTVMVRNNGMPFRTEDWNRLKKIAEGNPDENKVGAFGVGFYSLFSLCDEPLVSSGEKLMGFYWKDNGDQLYVKTAVTSAEDVSVDGKPWTTFLMDLRDKSLPMPEPMEFAKFLTTSLGFTANIRTISMYFDGHLLCKVSKTLAPCRSISLRTNLPQTSPLKILKITNVDEIPLQIRATMSRWMTLYSKPKPSSSVLTTASASNFASRMLSAFSSKPTPTPSPVHTPPPLDLDPFTTLSANLFLRVVSGHLKVTPTTAFQTDIVRWTKKPLPKTTVFSLIWTGKEEFDAGADGDEEVRKIFTGLMSDLTTNGRVFIGFPTFQTTGCSASIAARFVSTVERESIDFNEATINKWNRELLFMGGVLSRTIYEEEMSDIARIYKQNSIMPPLLATKLEERALHLMRFFTYSPSTPSPIVSADTEKAFFESLSNSSTLSIISQNGPLLATQVRLSNPQLSLFVHSIPIVPQHVADGAARMMNRLRTQGIICDISLEDILKDLEAHPLTITKATECFKWFSELTTNSSYDPSLWRKLKAAAMLVVEGSSKEDISIFPLSSFTTYINPKWISVDEPLPPHTLPFVLSKSFTGEVLSKRFGFQELSIVEWTRYLVSPSMIGKDALDSTNLLKSSEFSEKVFNTIVKGFGNVSPARQQELLGLLSPHPIIPTTQGLQLASASYFSNVILFDDLPIVAFPSRTPVKPALEKILTSLGVRRHVELQLVFTRLLAAGDWSHIDVAKYLVSVRSSLSNAEIDKLRKTAWLPKAGESKVLSEDGSAKKAKVIRYIVGTLFEPTEIFRNLGLPLLDWNSSQVKWRNGSEEAKFLFELGLLRTPSVQQILEIAADASNSTRQEVALNYFLTEYHTASFATAYSPNNCDFPFVPAVKNGSYIYSKPTETFTNQSAGLLGFPILSPRFVEHGQRLKLNVDPPSATLVAALLKSPPKSTSEARAVFSYLSSQVSKFNATDIATLSTSRLIPFERQNAPADLRLPNESYFNSTTSLPPGLQALFPSIPDFSPAAKQFLAAIGVRDSPSPLEIANRLVADPERFLELCNPENYLDILRLIAVNYNSLPVYIKSKLKASSFFLGTRRVPSTSIDDDEDDEDAGSSFTYSLAKPTEIVINDSPQIFRSFEYDVLSAPQDDLLEKFLLDLGAKNISALVRQDVKQTGEPDENSLIATKLSKVIKERTYLFISERLQAHSAKNEITHPAIDWIRDHLTVFEVRSIELSLSMTILGKLKRKSQPISAYAKVVRGHIQLFVSGALDYFEIASALVPHLISKQRSGDNLLFSVILSTSLNELKRRGINVGRILNARKQQQLRAEQQLKADRSAALERNKLALSEPQLSAHLQNLREMFPDADQTYLREVLQSQPPPHLENAVNLIMNTDYPRVQVQPPINRNNSATTPPGYRPTDSDSNSIDSNQRSSLMSKFKKLTNNKSNEGSSKPSTSALQSQEQQQHRPEVPTRPSPLPQLPNNRNPLSRPPTTMTGSTPDSTEGIRRNIDKAIRDSRPENSNTITSDSTKSIVKESESYCDASAGAHLTYVSEIAGLRFFADRSIQNVDQFVRDNLSSIERFTTLIVLPVGQVFGINPRSLHIFHDLTGPLIAFNRSGSIFINHRFYLLWHDEMVKKGDLNEALISVYHTLAHEIAHNLVGPHNSEHSFYFSTLCEKYFLRMSQLLSLN